MLSERKKIEALKVKCVLNNGSNRRCNIIGSDRRKNESVIIDPTDRFEMNKNQPEEVKDVLKHSIEIYKIIYTPKNDIKKFFNLKLKSFSHYKNSHVKRNCLSNLCFNATFV